MRVVYELIEPIVEGAVRKKRERATGAGNLKQANLDIEGGEKIEEGTLLENLVNETEDPEILRDEIMNLLVAGRDTVSYHLLSVRYCLDCHARADC